MPAGLGPDVIGVMPVGGSLTEWVLDHNPNRGTVLGALVVNRKSFTNAHSPSPIEHQVRIGLIAGMDILVELSGATVVAHLPKLRGTEHLQHRLREHGGLRSG
jgi:hypothetical protein